MSGQRSGGATGVFFLWHMDCSGCATILRGSLGRVEGVRSVAINYITDKVYVDYDPEKVTSEEIRKAIEKIGFKARAAPGGRNPKEAPP